jgi:hypothetical protein
MASVGLCGTTPAVLLGDEKGRAYRVPDELTVQALGLPSLPLRNELPEQHQLLSWSASKELVPGNRNGAGS